MTASIKDLFNTDHFLVDVPAAHARAAIEILTAPLVRSADVTPEFAADVWTREQSYPTGLPTLPIPIAIPHADPDHVRASAISIGVLRSPVEFAQMGSDGSLKLQVRLIFLLAIKERESQVDVIKQVVSLIQNPDLLEALTHTPTPAEGIALIQQALNS